MMAETAGEWASNDCGACWGLLGTFRDFLVLPSLRFGVRAYIGRYTTWLAQVVDPRTSSKSPIRQAFYNKAMLIDTL